MQHGDTLVLADAHLESFDEELELFLDFLHSSRQNDIQALLLLGDLFNIWIGTAKMELPHQIPVVKALQALYEHGVHLVYVEGNRDYFLAPRYLNPPFHEITSEGTQGKFGRHSIYFSHGDLVNLHDKQYRNWRRFSRNPLIFKLFSMLPQALAVAFVHKLEQTFRQSNQRHKSSFPLDTCREYAEQLWGEGYDTILLGHFHEQRRLQPSDGDARQQLLVLPSWKDGHRYLTLSPEGECAFHQFSA